MVCQSCLELERPAAVAASLPAASSVQDNGSRTRGRMQQSSSGSRQQVMGNNYTPFPSTVDRSLGHSCSLSPHALPLLPVEERRGAAGNRGPATQPTRQTLLRAGDSGHPRTSLPLPSTTPTAASLQPPSTTTSTTTPAWDSENTDSNDTNSTCTLPCQSTPSLVIQPPCAADSPSRPSDVYLYLYRQLPKVSCDVDLERLGRSMHGLQEGCFYYSDLDSNGARKMLLGSPEGTFLVRDSSDPRFLFAVTVKTAKGPTSVRIQYYRGFFQLDCEEQMRRKLPRFETLLDLLDFHVAVCREQQGAQYRWQEDSHKMDMVVRLTTPRRHSPPSLSHLARISVNRSLQDLHLPHRSTDLLPVAGGLRHFLRAYPFKV